MRALVTGACGFIGSHLVEALVRAGHDVTALCQYNSLGTTGWHDRKLCETILGDVRDYHAMAAAVGDSKASVVFHLAALIGIPYSYESSQSYIDTNITGTHNILQAAGAAGCQVIITSTSEVYGSCQIAPMAENHPLNAQSPYAATKIAADQLALSFHRSFGTPVTIVRPFNTYGPRQSLRAFIPQIICQLLDGSEVRLGNTGALRDLTFVDDTVAGFIAAMEHGRAGEVYNLGSGCAWRVEHTAQAIAGIMEKKMIITQDPARVRPEASEVDRLIADSRRAVEELHWRSTVPMLEGLRRTIEWFRENRGKYAEGGYAV